MNVQFYPILLIILASLIILRTSRAKRKNFLHFLFYLVSIGLITGSWGLFTEKNWAPKWTNISLIALVFLLVFPPFGRLLGVSIFTKMFYEGMEDNEEAKKD